MVHRRSITPQGHFDAVLTDLSLSDFTLSNPELPVNPSRFLKDSCVLLRITFEEMESENQANRLPSNDGSVFSVGSAAASAAPVGAPPTGPCVRRWRRTLHAKRAPPQRSTHTKAAIPVRSGSWAHDATDSAADKRVLVSTESFR